MRSEKTYSFRVRIQEPLLSFQIHIEQPRFSQLVEKIRQCATDLNIDDYDIAIGQTGNGHRTTLYDDRSLRQALQALTPESSSRLELVLYRRGAAPPAISDQSVSQQTDRATTVRHDRGPVAKPTVSNGPCLAKVPCSRQRKRVEWEHVVDPGRVGKPRSCTSDNDASSSASNRKDSGVAWSPEDDDEPPLKKKQRTVLPARASIVHSRKLPEPRPCYPPTTTTRSPKVHPLDPQQLMPPIQSTSSPAHTSITLPALSSIIRPEPLLPLMICPPLLTGRRHQQRAAAGGQFVCEKLIEGRMCGQTFRRSYDLSRHQTIHLKNRPYCYCSECGKKFTRMDALRRHERVQGHHSSSSSSTSRQDV